ncbi:amino acid ABC transporter membrane protein 2 (PAAT family) [Kribbella voronezhensis]|uniref:Amino acid ABC transporter membrane protein 2 (PAAT family) n=1 Tax=Kribbella voronezhensis TaxID=2512212 RepID=A0A4R7STZ8_9ACTN|nr:amino acid ABC transporter permease [Kribbella voronezhensis]TDU82574.1 amino acid ABC transporter membrane protein 2 (PAAT family) [Kribbella voronezhensis]
MSAGVLFDTPGPRSKRLYAAVGVASVVILLLILWFVLAKLDDKGQLTAAKWKPFLTGEIWTQYLIPGLLGTLKAAAISTVLALVLGVLLGVGRLSAAKWIRWPSSIVVEFFRAVPVLLMMLFAYALYGHYETFPADQIALAGVVTGLTLYNGSVIAELVRSGVHSLPKGQNEAALAIGLTTGKTMRLVLLPQAITAMMPAIVGQLVVILKDTALGYIITYEELLRKAEQIGNFKSNLLPALIFVGALFVIVNYLVSLAANKIEQRTRRRGRSAGGPLAPDQIDQAAVEVAAANANQANTGQPGF